MFIPVKNFKSKPVNSGSDKDDLSPIRAYRVMSFGNNITNSGYMDLGSTDSEEETLADKVSIQPHERVAVSGLKKVSSLKFCVLRCEFIYLIKIFSQDKYSTLGL